MFMFFVCWDRLNLIKSLNLIYLDYWNKCSFCVTLKTEAMYLTPGLVASVTYFLVTRVEMLSVHVLKKLFQLWYIIVCYQFWISAPILQNDFTGIGEIISGLLR